MKTIFKAVPLLLIIALLCGCSYQTYTKTVVLPTQNPDVNPESRTTDEDWTLKKIYQYQYSSSDVSYSSKNLFSSIGWAGDEHLLYTVDGGRGEEVTINKVDIRYGFYEECANLGTLNYNQMQLSPDGKYLLYDLDSEDGSRVILNLYSIADQTTRQITTLPNPHPLLMMNYIWSGDGNNFFFYFTPLRDSELLEKLSNAEEYREELTDYYESLLTSEENDNFLFKIMGYNMNEGQVKYLAHIGQQPTDSPSLSSLKQEVFSNADGSILLSMEIDEFSFSIIDLTTDDKTLTLSSENYYDLGFELPFYAYQITSHYICAKDDYNQSIYFIDLKSPDTVLSNSTLIEQNAIFLTNDESHALQIEYGDNDESLIYLYTCAKDDPSTLTGKTLLYQTKDRLSEITITPDDKHIIIRTQTDDSLSSYKDDYGETYVEESEAVNLTDGFWDKVSLSVDHKITILEL